MRHANVALFVPNNGCPHACSFCSQKIITGRTVQPSPADVVSAAEIALKSLGPKSGSAEIAFFGGSFTAIEREYMISLLKAAAPYVRNGLFSGIRISTRPDGIDSEILDLLRSYGVSAIELGAQSMNDRVLFLNGRGHTVRQVERASALIRGGGFSLGLQMMTGLYGDTSAGARETAGQLAALKPDCVRIYPTIVLKGTRLAELFSEGAYVPASLEETTELCADLLDFFEGRSIPVIRLGLHASPELERDRLAGPWHPAFRELCESRRFLRRAEALLSELHVPHGQITLWTNPRAVSAAVGQSRCNLQALSALGYSASVRQDSSVPLRKFRIQWTGGETDAFEIAGTAGLQNISR